MFISDAPNKDHPGTPRWWLLIFRRIVSAEYGIDLHRCHAGFLRQQHAELAQRNHMHVLQVVRRAFHAPEGCVLV